MVLFGYKRVTEDRYLPVSPAAAFTAVRMAAERSFKVAAIDQLLLTVDLRTIGPSLSGFGERVLAQVIPSGEGCLLRLTVGPAGISGGVLQSKANQQAIDSVFRAVAKQLHGE